MDEKARTIEHDPQDHSREYIPLPGGWEVQTKGAGSSYRLLDKKTGERHLILTGKDWMGLQAFFTRFAHEVFEASRQIPEPESLSPGSTGETEGLKLGSRLTVEGVEAVVVGWREWLCATAETRGKEHMDRLLADPDVRSSLRRSAAGER